MEDHFDQGQYFSMSNEICKLENQTQINLNINPFIVS